LIPSDSAIGFTRPKRLHLRERETIGRAAGYQAQRQPDPKDTAMNGSELKHLLPLMVPIVAIVLGIGAGMLAIWLDYSRRRQIFELHHKERLAAIERGMEVPPLPAEFFRGGSGRQRETEPTDYLRRGLIWLLVGVALTIALLLNRNVENATWGLLPTAVGLAYLIYYAAAPRRARSAPQERGPTT
jgi:Domain of unknown function (DUF6249)